MKLFFTLALLAEITGANATIRVVTCQNSPSHFLPVTVNAICGDTIRWTWVAGVHIVGPINASYIPTGAAMWNAPIDVNNTSFQYVVTVAGNYHYVCHPATPHGEDAYIVVTCSSGIPQYTSQAGLLLAYPNPSHGIFQLTFDNVHLAGGNPEIIIYNVLGEQVYVQELLSQGMNDFWFDLTDRPKGVYFIRLQSGQGAASGKVLIQ